MHHIEEDAANAQESCPCQVLTSVSCVMNLVLYPERLLRGLPPRHFSQTRDLLSPRLMWSLAQHFPVLLYQERPPFSPLGIITKSCCVPCSCGRRVITSSPSTTSRVSARFFVETWQQRVVHFLELRRFTRGGRRSCIVHLEEGLQGFRRSVLTAFSKAFQYCIELVPFVSSMLPSRPAPPHAVFLSSFFMVGGHPAQEFLHREQLAVLTDMSEPDDRPSFSLTTCSKKSVFFFFPNSAG